MPYDVIFKGTLLNGVEVERKVKRCKLRRDAGQCAVGFTGEAASDGFLNFNRTAFAIWSFDVVKAPLLLRGMVKGGAQ